MEIKQLWSYCTALAVYLLAVNHKSSDAFIRGTLKKFLLVSKINLNALNTMFELFSKLEQYSTVH